MNEITRLDQNASLKQANSLVEAKYRLTTYEQRMIIAICSQLKNETDLPKIHVRIDNLADFCKFPASKKLDMVRSTARKLRSRTLEFLKPDGKWYITGWINSADLLEDGTIEFVIDEKLKPHLLQLKSAYLLTPAAPLMEFKCDYTARLYFLMKKMLKVHTFEYKLDFIRERFHLSKSYDIFFNLKSKVIEPALAEINAKSDISVRHEYIKSGRTYTKIKFTVTLKAPKALSAPASETVTEEKQVLETRQTQLFEEPKTPEPQNEEELEHLGRLGKYEIAPQTGRRLIKKYGWERIDANLKYAYEHRQRKENMSGWIIDCIKNDRAAGAAEAKRLAKKAADKKQKEFLARLEPLPFEVEPPRELPADSPFKRFERKPHAKRAVSKK